MRLDVKITGKEGHWEGIPDRNRGIWVAIWCLMLTATCLGLTGWLLSLAEEEAPEQYVPTFYWYAEPPEREDRYIPRPRANVLTGGLRDGRLFSVLPP